MPIVQGHCAHAEDLADPDAVALGQMPDATLTMVCGENDLHSAVVRRGQSVLAR